MPLALTFFDDGRAEVLNHVYGIVQRGAETMRSQPRVRGVLNETVLFWYDKLGEYEGIYAVNLT